MKYWINNAVFTFTVQYVFIVYIHNVSFNKQSSIVGDIDNDKCVGKSNETCWLKIRSLWTVFVSVSNDSFFVILCFSYSLPSLSLFPCSGVRNLSANRGGFFWEQWPKVQRSAGWLSLRKARCDESNRTDSVHVDSQRQRGQVYLGDHC